MLIKSFRKFGFDEIIGIIWQREREAGQQHQCNMAPEH